ncbi:MULTISPECIES: FMNH2-dependent alkanesulfonate monooxygenase [Paenibacillus]|uniref:Alkanesulfonate monooxygenase n=1 Tax=Paenibacillus campinasensis TaxID=66347 RepID=A0A268EV81_9BACL|nr:MULTISPECIES: FMNH2-dependent alkanesulfonate monooxygenase [Paenibacillus]MUG66917.1 FMNH2-dependent alkanesulfonate monooxygenase [Paenibacillus campinasensis]PAD77033.1 alkanesulfonate monooxygenase, FMNH(2)-dependent [Paenibacillus campinasensis]PAK55929.1 alkanesulfonate monooxygenase, FMNH(2)-dependent [Paenibacillus sp. 7541]
MEMFWYLPTMGDGRYLGTSHGAKITDLHYFRQVAQAVDRLGYTGMLVPTGHACEDGWVVASSLITATERLKFLVAVRPGGISVSIAARMAASFDRLSSGRLLINVVTGGDPVEMKGDGIFLSHHERYEATDEFLQVWHKLMTGERVTFHGTFIQVEDARLQYVPFDRQSPPLFIGASSDAGHEVAAKHIDTYLTWAETPAMVAEKIADVRERAQRYGRSIKIGLRVQIIVRETAEEAWEAAHKLIQYVTEEDVQEAQALLNRFDSVGQRRMSQLVREHRDTLEISPNLWAGIGQVRGGVGTALVGSPDEVAQRLLEYAALGIDTFILSGYPHLEEAYRIAELLFPRLPVTYSRPPEEQHWTAMGELLAENRKPKPKEA